MEKSTPIGVVLGFVLIFGTIFMGAGPGTFFDLPSFLIVFGGTLAALFVQFSLSEISRLPRAFRRFLGFRAPDLTALIHTIGRLARLARRDGLLAVDRELKHVADPFLRTGLELAVDGRKAEEIDEILRERMDEHAKSRQLGARACSAAGMYSPAMGMIGTLIGLIQMLQNLADPAQIGPGMAVALITTFYGAFLANILFLPVAAKMRQQGRLVLKAQELVRQGILGLVDGENPGQLETKLRLFLPDDHPVPRPAAAPPTEVAAVPRAA